MVLLLFDNTLVINAVCKMMRGYRPFCGLIVFEPNLKVLLRTVYINAFILCTVLNNTLCIRTAERKVYLEFFKIFIHLQRNYSFLTALV